MWPRWLTALLVMLQEAWSVRRDAQVRFSHPAKATATDCHAWKTMDGILPSQSPLRQAERAIPGLCARTCCQRA